MGMPPSQVCGVFHGRTEPFPASWVAQPLAPKITAPNANNQSQWTARRFMSGSRMRRRDFVAFKNLSELPARHDIRDAAVLFHGANNDLGNEFAVAADQHFAIFHTP